MARCCVRAGGPHGFLHFLAIFPSLLILLACAEQIPSIVPLLKATILAVAEEFLAPQASSLVEQMLAEFDRHMPIGLELASACVGALWAPANGTWALVYGFNIAYEVEECRACWKLGITVVGMMFSLALADSHAAAPALCGLEWLTVLALLTFSFALVCLLQICENTSGVEHTRGCMCPHFIAWLDDGRAVYFST